MSEPTFGITFTRRDDEPRPVIASDMSVIGIVGTAPDAVADDFPINEPVEVRTNNADQLTALGATGTLPDALRGISDQLGDFQVAARTVVVRVEEGVDDDATTTNLLGSEGGRTGLYALLDAGPELGVTPPPYYGARVHAQHAPSEANPIAAALPACAELLAHAHCRSARARIRRAGLARDHE